MEHDQIFFDVGARIRQLRGALGQSEFAERLGVDRKSVAGWEAGKRLPDGKSLLALMQVFGGSASYLLTGTEGGAQLTDASEQLLIDAYRRCNADARRHLIQSAALLSAGMGVSPPAAAPSRVKHQPDLRGLKQTSNTPGAVQVGYAAGKVSIKRR